MFYFQLRHNRTGEVTSVFRDTDDWHSAPGVLLYSEDDYDYEDMFKAEDISKEEYETLLTFHGIDLDHPSQNIESVKHGLDFWLFTGGDCP